MKKLMIDPERTKTYKTVANMEKAVDNLAEKIGLPSNVAYLQVEVDGRFTPVFTNLTQGANAMFVSYVIHSGFMVVG
jgi:hypothetical protein